MAFFPDRVMPKMLRHESGHEVDGDPNILNAADWNRHHRELIAIERLLIGNQIAGSAASGVAGFSCYDFSTGLICPGINLNPGQDPTDAPKSIQDAINIIAALVDGLTNSGFLAQHTGTLCCQGQVPIPANIVSTTTPGGLLSSATRIPVASTAGFPSSGFITKFNYVHEIALCTQGGVPVKGRCAGANNQVVHDLVGLSDFSPPYHVTNQEFIQYTSITPTSFEGCTRGYAGTTVQDLLSFDAEFSSQGALIISGRASIFFTHNFWGSATAAQPSQVLIDNDALLHVQGLVFKDGTPSSQQNIQNLVEIGYSLSVLGQFDNIDLSGIYNLLEL